MSGRALDQSDGYAADQSQRAAASVAPIRGADAALIGEFGAEPPGAGVVTLPYARFSPNLYPACQNAFRGPDGECFDRPVMSAGGGNGT
jgi:hypothetical protein